MINQIIYDINLDILQNITNAHDRNITYIEIKDENNFITCADDESRKLCINKDNKFQSNKIINNAHDDIISNYLH